CPRVSRIPSGSPLLLVPSFFYHAPSPTHLYTLSLHDALPIYRSQPGGSRRRRAAHAARRRAGRRPRSEPVRHDARGAGGQARFRSEEHTSELQSQSNLVCRLLLEKKKKKNNKIRYKLI